MNHDSINMNKSVTTQFQEIGDPNDAIHILCRYKLQM